MGNASYERNLNQDRGPTGSGCKNKSPDTIDTDHRRRWMARRLALEGNRHKVNRYGKKRKSRWSLFEMLIRLFGRALKIAHIHDWGVRNARRVRIHDVDAVFSDLPTSFHGYTILQLTDLHLDSMGDIGDVICEQLRDETCDLCVLTGDYREDTRGRFDQILQPLARIIDTVNARDGVLVTLGNHDTVQMAAHFDGMGATLLTNETVSIHRGDDAIAVTGIDDPHYYYTPQAVDALGASEPGFKVCLVHTPELYDIAAAAGYRLYLCGHTHGGQICLPGGIPIITHLYAGRKYARGMWHLGRMVGYTSSGCGTVGIPVRFNCPGEIARIRLQKRLPSP